ncbi:zinc finger protein interacting with ribonucleoprotein K-like [Acipenser ruthenus]|uniref:zinc finger protein interacting with ribonucleoprotein K-like n=1 Tax=Acipenser ruthenus TaxID=7906 RepID=UPI0027428129|nr:zinc finger protein interacting with ribonucleoprotein K-like [Acipenser ruthenus]XP_058873617.1 zinc finger protein interacting with ribonucleoprotein K-like [Acipenser ruthenus]
MEAAHISPELPIRWVVSADRTLEIKEEVTELGCDQANERILQEETPPSSITERDTDLKLVCLGRRHGSEIASSYIKEEASETEHVHIKEELPEAAHIKPEAIKPGALLNEGETSHDLYTNGEDGAELGSIQRKHHISQLEAIQTHPSSQHGPRSPSPRGTTMLGKNLQQIHTGDKPHNCTECGKSFTHLGNFKQHQRSHTGEKPHHCIDCGRSFTYLGTFRRHQCVHTGEKRFHCTECGNSFTRLGSLKQHQLIHTGEKPHQCNECGKSFIRSGRLKQHQLIHTGEKPHHCTTCGKSFIELGSLKKHQRLHTGEKTHNCNECEKSFSQIGNLKKHQRIHNWWNSLKNTRTFTQDRSPVAEEMNVLKSSESS